jgi:cytochrome c oxidase assembly protein subunit 15
VAFLLPFLWFWIRGRIPKGYWPALLGLFALGGLQGGVGWVMVASGLVDRPSVSHYRLTLHLALAVVIYVAMLWTAFGLLQPRGPIAAHAGIRRWSRVVYVLIAVTIIYGAFVAGLRAGWIYNTFPWMGDGLVPAGYWLKSLGWRNLVENHDTVQFNHRLLATLTLLAIIVLWGAARRKVAGLRRAATWLVLSVLLQYGLGITTILLFDVDVARPPLAGGLVIGTLHQAGAMVLVTAAVWSAHAARAGRARPRASQRISVTMLE